MRRRKSQLLRRARRLPSHKAMQDLPKEFEIPGPCQSTHNDLYFCWRSFGRLGMNIDCKILGEAAHASWKGVRVPKASMRCNSTVLNSTLRNQKRSMRIEIQYRPAWRVLRILPRWHPLSQACCAAEVLITW